MIENHNTTAPIECQAGKPPRIFPVAKKIEMMQTYDRAWAYFMSMHASHVFRTVLSDDTISWSRPSVTVTYGEIATRCNISISTVQRAIKELREIGLVETVPSGRGLVYYVMMEVLMRRDIPVPKRVREANMNTQSGQYDLPECSNRTPSNISISLDIKTSETAKKQTNETVTEARSRTLAAVERGRMINESSRMKLNRTKRRSPAGMEYTWKMFHGKNAAVEMWTHRERASVTEWVKVWDRTIPELHALLEWSIINWSMMMDTEFKWMRSAPVKPNIYFLKRHADKFWEAREQNTGQSWREGPHAKEIAKLLRAGNDKEARKLMGGDNG